MPTEAIVCPTCRAADTSRADPNGVHTCVYCGARYRISGAAAAAIPKASTPVRKARAVVLGAMTIVVALGTGAFLVTRSAPAARPALQSTKVFPVVSVPNAIAVVTPEPPASARFEFQSKASGHEASFYVLGWVTNTSPFAIDRPKVVAVLVDAAGKEVGTRQGFSSANDLGPGEKSAIKVLITDPPEYAELRYEVVARKASYRTPRAASLRVEPVKPARASFGNAWDVSGKVFNDGTEPAKFVRVTVLAYDGQGGLIGVNETYADRATEGLAPGAAARFTAPHSFPGITPARFEFQVDGATAKP